MLEKGMILIDRYEILSKVGAGGMSDVYKAKDHILGRIVAIKVMKAEFSEDVNFVTKFRTEAQSAAGLEHPNIVNIYDVGSENGLHFIVMEYVEGITLKTYIEKKGQLSFKEATSIAIQVARGIETAHNKEIIHRDIKPQNIIISTEGKVKVTDFGIARALSSNTISAEVMGSVHYASPEQARNGFVDGRSDIYSLGIVMYEMVTGRVPFDGDTTVSVAIQHLQEEMVGPSVYAPDLPISYEKIVLKSTQKNADRRYQTIEELLVDLRKVLANPDEDFVVIAPAAVAKTRIIGGEELEAIQAAEVNMDDKNEFANTSELEDIEEYDEDEDYDDYDDDDDDDTTGFLNPTLEKVVNVVLIALAILIIAAVIWLGISIAGLLKNPDSSQQPSSKPTQTESSEDESTEIPSSTTPTESEETVEMIDITGLHVDRAKEFLKALGLGLNVISSESSDQPDGTVLYQSEIEGAQVPKGAVINVVTAGENESIVKKTVPEVIGYDEAVAKAILEAAGFLMEVDYDYSDTVEKDLICAQDPEAGDKVKVGSRIKVTISLGKAPVTVPDHLVGETQSVAEYVLENAGFVVEIATEYNDDYAEGYVIGVDGAGTSVPYGSTIVVHVSMGPEPTETEEPSVTEEPTDTENSSETETEDTEVGGEPTEEPSSEETESSESEGSETEASSHAEDDINSEDDINLQDAFNQFLEDLFG